MQVKQYLSFTVWPLMMTSLVLGGGRYPPELVPFAISVEKRKRVHTLNIALNLCRPLHLGGLGSASAGPTPRLRSPAPSWEAPDTRHTNGPALRLWLLVHAGGRGHIRSAGQWGESTRVPHPPTQRDPPPSSIHSLQCLPWATLELQTGVPGRLSTETLPTQTSSLGHIVT